MLNRLTLIAAFLVVAFAMAAPNGLFVDTRDGNVYKLSLVDSTVWLGANLDHRMGVDYKCFDEKPANCTKYGALYNWKRAGFACPTGWRLPTSKEFQRLAAAEKVEMLKSADWNGYDKKNFGAMPGGYMDNAGFWNLGKQAYYWTSDESGKNKAVSWSLEQKFEKKDSDKNDLLSVRCVASDSSIIRQAFDYWQLPPEEAKDGVVLDRRDGRRYKVFASAGMSWFAENLDFKIGGSFCYDNVAENCVTFGRLYSWKSAQLACPDGWRLPKDGEMKSISQGNLMMALPGGEKTDDGFWGKGKYGTFWTSTEVDKGHAYYWEFSSKWKQRSVYKEHGKSVRCVREIPVVKPAEKPIEKPAEQSMEKPVTEISK